MENINVYNVWTKTSENHCEVRLSTDFLNLKLKIQSLKNTDKLFL